MSVQVMPTQYAAVPIQPFPSANKSLATELLTNEHQQEVLAFLAERPLHTVFLAGYIRDNNLVSPLNRGSYYACRDNQSQIEGVALIGRAILVESRSERSLAAFARLARNCPEANLIMGEQHKLERFWHHYAQDGEASRLICCNHLLEQRQVVAGSESVLDLRTATPVDLTHVMRVNAEMFVEACGVNPLETDPDGFRRRTARRIEQGRVWVWTAEDKLMFKADVIADTPEVVYLEGIYVNPAERSKGYGLRCLRQLSRNLLARAGSICLTVDEHEYRAQDFYRKAGFQFHSHYSTIYFEHRNN